MPHIGLNFVICPLQGLLDMRRMYDWAVSHLITCVPERDPHAAVAHVSNHIDRTVSNKVASTIAAVANCSPPVLHYER